MDLSILPMTEEIPLKALQRVQGRRGESRLCQLTKAKQTRVLHSEDRSSNTKEMARFDDQKPY
jgi:hypothetical protein